MKKGYSQEEVFAVIFESERDRKRRRVQAIVIETVAAQRLKKIREFLAYQELATWRRMNGFDRLADGEDKWFHGHRSLPPTPEKFAADLWCEVNALKDPLFGLHLVTYCIPTRSFGCTPSPLPLH